MSQQLCCESLVALVKEHPSLYDYSHPAHYNRDVTSRLWTDIASQLCTSDIVCKTKWANLRSNFVRELRRIRPSEDGKIWPPSWPLFKPLSFLIPFLKTRGSYGSTSIIDDQTLLALDLQETTPNNKRSSNECFADDMTFDKRLRLEAESDLESESLQVEDETDDDKLFMLSLVPKMRQLPTLENLAFRIEVQQLLLNKLCHSRAQNLPQE